MRVQKQVTLAHATCDRPQGPLPAFTCTVSCALRDERELGARARAGPLPDRPPGDRVRARPARERLDLHQGTGADVWQHSTASHISTFRVLQCCYGVRVLSPGAGYPAPGQHLRRALCSAAHMLCLRAARPPEPRGAHCSALGLRRAARRWRPPANTLRPTRWRRPRATRGRPSTRPSASGAGAVPAIRAAPSTR